MVLDDWLASTIKTKKETNLVEGKINFHNHNKMVFIGLKSLGNTIQIYIVQIYCIIILHRGVILGIGLSYKIHETI